MIKKSNKEYNSIFQMLENENRDKRLK